MNNYIIIYKELGKSEENKIMVIAENEENAKIKFNEFLGDKINFYKIESICEQKEFNKTDLKKMKKNDLIDLVYHIQNLEENESILSIVRETQEEQEFLNDTINDKDLEIQELEKQLEHINDIDFFYSLKNNLDDLINNVSRETFERTVNELRFDLENLERFYLTLKGVNHSN